MSLGEIGSVLRESYQRRFEANAEYRRRVWGAICSGYLQRLIPEHAALLDVGCGWGEFINQIRAATKYAIDLNPDAATHLGPDVRFMQQDCSKPWPLGEGTLDVVFSSNFLEHLTHKDQVASTLAQALRALKSGGKIILLGPNIRHTAGAYWDYWDHHVPISDQSIAEVLELTGFQIDTQIGRFLPYTMSNGRQPPLAFVGIYLRLPLLWRLFGKQFLVVARKP